MRVAVGVVCIAALSACANNEYWTKTGGSAEEFDRVLAGCHNQAFSLPKSQTPQINSPQAYSINTMRLGGAYVSTVQPYENPYQSLGNAFSSMSDSLANMAMKERFMDNCMVANGWKKQTKPQVSITEGVALSASEVAITEPVFAKIGADEKVYKGTATGYSNRTGTMKMISPSNEVCVGNFRYTSSLGGNGTLICDHGDSASINFTKISTTSGRIAGYGSGTSNTGSPILFVYGIDEIEGAKYLKMTPFPFLTPPKHMDSPLNK